MRIGIDIDGVLIDIEQWQLDHGSKFYYEKYKKEIVNDARYNQECKGKNIYRCYSWYDIYAKIGEIK